MKAFCVRCGREGETYDGLCAECFLDSMEPISLPPRVDLEMCTNCGEYRVAGRWEAFPSATEAAEAAAVAELRVIKGGEAEQIVADSEGKDARNFEVHLEVRVAVRGLEKETAADTTVRVKNTVCHRCSRILGNYYEAILQVRGTDKALDQAEKDRVLIEVAERVEAAARTNRQMFVSKVEDIHGGVDVYLSSSSLARGIWKELANIHGAEVKESSSLVGRREGEDMYRMTFLLRLPPYRVGDIVTYGEGIYLLSSLAGGAKLVSLADHRQTTVKAAELRHLRVVGSTEDAREAVVVSATDDEMQILHPQDYSMVTLRRPEGLPVGETVRVFMHEEEPFLLPQNESSR